MEVYEFHHLIAEGYGPQESAFLSAFFTLVGTHGLHVTFGLIWMAVSPAFNQRLERQHVDAFPVLKPVLAFPWYRLVAYLPSCIWGWCNAGIASEQRCNGLHWKALLRHWFWPLFRSTLCGHMRYQARKLTWSCSVVRWCKSLCTLSTSCIWKRNLPMGVGT